MHVCLCVRGLPTTVFELGITESYFLGRVILGTWERSGFYWHFSIFSLYKTAAAPEGSKGRGPVFRRALNNGLKGHFFDWKGTLFWLKGHFCWLRGHFCWLRWQYWWQLGHFWSLSEPQWGHFSLAPFAPPDKGWGPPPPPCSDAPEFCTKIPP